MGYAWLGRLQYTPMRVNSMDGLCQAGLWHPPACTRSRAENEHCGGTLGTLLLVAASTGGCESGNCGQIWLGKSVVPVVIMHVGWV